MFGWGFIAEPQKFPLTPFLRSLLVSEKMKALKTLQELRVLGTASDQRATLVRVMTLCDA